MAVEIERKFLLRDDSWRNAVHRSVPMAQGYLNDAAALARGEQRASVRVRLQDDVAFLNIKSREVGLSRQEFEYPVPTEDARALLELCVGGRIEKRRHLVRHGAHLWEIDEFEGDNAGLVVAEIELGDEHELFERPDWLGNEVTQLQRYYNLALADRPYRDWSRDERVGH
ncbi:CYTH domain-containing protein [Luteimonas yindakuii]|uniref:CYTH domain-containing protein n=1 Tax=Luteimonas yindakuii TaxID=2565782 RepID=UPI0010A52006|nr:CYTH domain-containing protein [Luteimonas yindakuii]QCO68058.1 CYTH domain-containing protein [Luteimonas yindakuii]